MDIMAEMEIPIKLKHLAHLMVERLQVEPLTAEEAKQVLGYMANTVIPEIIPTINHNKFREFVILPPYDVIVYRHEQYDLEAKRQEAIICEQDL